MDIPLSSKRIKIVVERPGDVERLVGKLGEYAINIGKYRIS